MESGPVRRVLGGPALKAGAGAAVLVTLAHGVNDAYAAFLSPLLPRLMTRLGLSIALTAMLAMTLSLSASLIQPLTGFLSDRIGRKPLVTLGPLVTGVFLSLIGVAPSYGILLLFLVLGGMGSAAFHPPGASLAARISEGRGSGLRYSIFSFGGSVGYAAGPLISVGLVAWLGFHRLWLAMLPAGLLALSVLLFLPADPPRVHVEPPPSPRQVLHRLAGPLGVVFGISAAQAFVMRVYLTMEPLIVAHVGGSEDRGALCLSVYLAGQAIGTLTGGVLTDRVDRRTLLTTLTLLSVPAHLAVFSLNPTGSLVLVAAAVAGMVNMAILPPTIIVAQESLPSGAAVSSGIAMGLAWSVGAIGVLGTGILGDAVGARRAAMLSVPVLLVGTILSRHRALARHSRPADVLA